MGWSAGGSLLVFLKPVWGVNVGGFEVPGAAGEGREVSGEGGRRALRPALLHWTASTFLLPALSRRGGLSCLLQSMQQIPFRLILHLS